MGDPLAPNRIRIKTHCPAGHKMSTGNVRTFQYPDQRYASGIRIERHCILCARRNNRRWRRRQKIRKRRVILINQIPDFLDIAGGWWTVAALADRFGAREDSTRKALSRLKDDGIVICEFHPPRWEWKVVAQPDRDG